MSLTQQWTRFVPTANGPLPWRRLAAFTIALLFPLFAWGQASADFDRAVEKVAASVVQIETVGGGERLGGQLRASAPSTGVVVGADGWILSSSFNLSHHPSGIVVTLDDGTKHAAKLAAEDKSRLLALLKIDAEGLPVPEAVPRSEVVVGKSTVALGKSWEASVPSRSYGIISATNRIWGKALQTDANVSPANYGGPLIDASGRVFGVLTPLSPQQDAVAAGVQWYDSGIGFAVPFEDVLTRLEQLKQGELQRGLLGVRFPSGDLLSSPKVDYVSWRSPAALAGMQTGDVIEAINAPAGWASSATPPGRCTPGMKFASAIVAARRSMTPRRRSLENCPSITGPSSA
jgi:serine protease Do